jgi:putative transposase
MKAQGAAIRDSIAHGSLSACPRSRGNVFFHGCLRDRRAATLIDHVDFLRSALREARKRRQFEIDAMVILPDHLHAAWTLPEGDADYSGSGGQSNQPSSDG